MIALTENPNETELWDVLRDRVGRHGGDALVVVAGGAARGPAGVLVRVPLLPRVAAVLDERDLVVVPSRGPWSESGSVDLNLNVLEDAYDYSCFFLKSMFRLRWALDDSTARGRLIVPDLRAEHGARQREHLRVPDGGLEVRVVLGRHRARAVPPARLHPLLEPFELARRLAAGGGVIKCRPPSARAQRYIRLQV